MQACCPSHSKVIGTYWRGGDTGDPNTKVFTEVNISSGLQLFLAKMGKPDLRSDFIKSPFWYSHNK